MSEPKRSCKVSYSRNYDAGKKLHLADYYMRASLFHPIFNTSSESAVLSTNTLFLIDKYIKKKKPWLLPNEKAWDMNIVEFCDEATSCNLAHARIF